MSNSRFWNRKIHLIIKGSGISVDVKNIDIKFKVEYMNSENVAYLDATIVGLKRENVEEFSKLTNMWDDLIIRKKIEVTLYAGYENCMILLFSGILKKASIGYPPEYAVHIVSQEATLENYEEVEIKLGSSDSLQKYIEQINFKKQGWIFKNVSHVIPNNVKVGAFSKKASFKTLVNDLESKANWKFIFGKDFIISAMDRIPISDTKYTGIEISEENGLLRVDFENAKTANITTWMQDLDNVIGKRIFFRSKIYSAASGYYHVKKVTYRGDYLGKEWYSMISCFKCD